MVALTFYVTIVWAVGYWIVYPAWPTLNGYTTGLFSYSQRDVVTRELSAARSAQAQYREKLAQTLLPAIKLDPDLYRFAMAAGTVAFQNSCAACHGRGAQGFLGYPNLNDDDWLWGGTIEDIHKTISFGVRADGKDTRASQMPRYGIDKLLPEAEINDVVEFVLSLSKKSSDAAAVNRGQRIFADQCISCHGADGKGKQEQGAPNLSDPIWLYGDSRQSILESVRTGRGAMMPPGRVVRTQPHSRRWRSTCTAWAAANRPLSGSAQGLAPDQGHPTQPGHYEGRQYCLR